MRAVGALLPMGLVFILLSGTLLRAQEEKAPSDSVAAYPLPIPALSPSPVIQPKQQTFSRVADQNFWLLTGITYAPTVHRSRDVSRGESDRLQQPGRGLSGTAGGYQWLHGHELLLEETQSELVVAASSNHYSRAWRRH